MAKQDGEQKIIIDLSCKGGLYPRWFGDIQYGAAHPELAIANGPSENRYAKGTVNPLSKFGYLNPANNTQVAVQSVASGAIMQASVIDAINKTGYFLNRGSKLYKAASYHAAALTTSFTIGAAGPVGIDLAIYTVNGVRKLFYSFQTSVPNGDIGIFDFVTTNNDGWLSGIVSGAFQAGANNLIMTVADNGFMYVLDGASVHKIDGTTAGGANGTATANVLKFPATFQCIDAIDAQGKMWIAQIRSTRNLWAGNNYTDMYIEDAGVYVWDRQAATASTDNFIPVQGISGIYTINNFRGQPALFTISMRGYAQLRLFDGSGFSVVAQMGQNDFPRFKDSVFSTDEGLTWMANSGKIFYYGRIAQGESDGLHIIGDMSANITSLSAYQIAGAILYMGDNNPSVGAGGNTQPESFYLSWQDSINTVVKQWYPHMAATVGGVTQNAHAGNFVSMVFETPKLCQITGMTIFFPPITGQSGSTTALSVDVYLNQSTTSWGTTKITYADLARGYKFIPMGNASSGVNFVQLGVVFPTTIAMSNIPTSLYAEIEYRPTMRKI